MIGMTAKPKSLALYYVSDNNPHMNCDMFVVSYSRGEAINLWAQYWEIREYDITEFRCGKIPCTLGVDRKEGVIEWDELEGWE